MSELVKKYRELAKKRSDENLTEGQDDDIIKEMTKVKMSFKESDWDELIADSPLYIRPMLKQQKEKFMSK